MAINSADVTAGVNATATHYNNLRKDYVMGYMLDGAETDGATITIDWSAAAKGRIRNVTIAGNRTIAFSNATVGQAIAIRITQDATGSRLITWPTIRWPAGVTPTLTTAANKTDMFLIYCIATNVYEGYIVGQNLGA